MPIGEYFHGEGESVMTGMRKKYGKRAKQVFYATANAKKMTPGSHLPEGTSQTPKGDIGYARQEEAIALGTFSGITCRHTSEAFPKRAIRKAR